MPARTDRTRLTSAQIRKLKHDPNGSAFQVTWDTEQPGLGLRVRASRKVFVARYRDPEGVNRRVTLGEWSEKERRGTLTLKQARAAAALRISSGRAGADEPNPVNNGATLADAFEKLKAKRWSRLSDWTRRGYQARWNAHLGPALGNKKLDRITGGDVEDLYRSLKDKPTTANHVVGLLGTIWNSAARRGDMGIDLMTPNPTKVIGRDDRYPKRVRKRRATAEELTTFLENVDEAEQEGRLTPHEAFGLLLVPYTLLRISDVLRLRWEWIDKKTGVITIPAKFCKGARIARSDEPEHAVLSKPMLDRLRELEQLDEHVVPSSRGGGRYDLKIPYEAVRPAADLGLYDFKTTSETMLRDAGVSQAWIDAAARHRPQGVGAKHYAHPTIEQAEKAVERLAELLEAARA